jgi:hypothetical protein
MFRIAPGIVLVFTAAMCVAQTRDLPGMAAGIVAQADLARQAVHSRDQSAALDHIRQAQSLAAEIQSKAAGQPQPLLVPIRQEKETTTTYTDVKRSKSGEMTASRLKKHTHISDVEQQISADELNVTAAADHLRAAQSDLERMDWTAADTDLASAGNLVHRDITNRDMPLMQVQRNLMLARQRLAEQKNSAAVLPLREAARALADFERQGASPQAQQAEAMRQNIEAMASHIHHEASIATIDDWLRTLEQWQKP